MPEINYGGETTTKKISVVSAGNTRTTATRDIGSIAVPKKSKKKKGIKPKTQNYSDPNGLIAAKLNAAKYTTWDAELGRYKVVDK